MKTQPRNGKGRATIGDRRGQGYLVGETDSHPPPSCLLPPWSLTPVPTNPLLLVGRNSLLTTAVSSVLGTSSVVSRWMFTPPFTSKSFKVANEVRPTTPGSLFSPERTSEGVRLHSASSVFPFATGTTTTLEYELSLSRRLLSSRSGSRPTNKHKTTVNNSCVLYGRSVTYVMCITEESRGKISLLSSGSLPFTDQGPVCRSFTILTLN